VVAAARNRRRGAFSRLSAPEPQPLAVVTNWGAHGALVVGIFLAAMAVAALLYRRALARAASWRLDGLIAIALLALAAAWCVPVLFSSDVYAYAAYGELARLGLDPYAHPPSGVHDVLLQDAASQWATSVPPSATFPVCVYGPAFVGLARAIVSAFAPLGTLAQLDALRALATSALLACAPLAYAAFPGDRAAKLRAAATIALNPVAIWCAAEGHNDAIALAIVLAGFALARCRLYGIGAAIVAFSGLVKLPGAVAAIAFGALDRRARAGAAIGIALAALFSIPLFIGLENGFVPSAHYAPQASLQGIFTPLSPALAALVAAAACATLAASGVARLRRGSAEGWAWLGLAAWVLIPNPYPWYGVWLVALAALAPRSRAATAALLLSFTALLRYVPDAVARPSPAQAVVLSIAATLPLLAVLPGWYNERPDDR
jgi:hypothetical protein